MRTGSVAGTMPQGDDGSVPSRPAPEAASGYGAPANLEAARRTLSLPPGVQADLFRTAQAERFDFTPEEFAAILVSVATRYLGESATETRVAEFARELRLAELALARACAQGNERAWTLFLTRYRESLYRSALAMTEEGTARELADSVYADLYGLEVRDGKRCSKLERYDGRGSLEGWLRSVLAHECINRWRGGRRLVSLEEQTEAGREFRAPEPQGADTPADPRLEAAAAEALAALAAEEKFLLVSYYLDERTLAEIAAALGVHESTVSRRLARTVRTVSKRIVTGLRRRGMSRTEAREALEADVRDLTLDVRRHLLTARKEPGTVPDRRGASG
jgi:RNA polymerase sigma-70 factor, ECF subfamily